MKRLLLAPLFYFLALSAIAVKKVSRKVPGSEKRAVVEVTFDNSYPTGGEVLTAKEIGLRRITLAECFILSGTESAVLRVGNAVYDKTTEKLKLIDNATGKELANASDASKVVVQVVAYGS
jgi:hypothetical protein